MRRFIARHLPDLGTFGTADLFRERWDLHPNYYIGYQSHLFPNEAMKINDEFCKLLEGVASYCDDNYGGVYDPVYVKKALKVVE